MAVDIPATATLLAQAAGRLIRHKNDSGVVAVLDRRLADSKYSSVLLSSLPFPQECLVRRRSVVIGKLKEIDSP
jgi:Rad3-related DNA helicase